MKSKWLEGRNCALGTWTALCGITALVNLACAQIWDGQAAPALAWQAVAASVDGNLLLAAPNGASIYLSTNAGAAWNPSSAPTNLWQAAAISANGAVMVAAAGISFQTGDPPSISGDGLIYTSMDSGTTWMPTMAPNNAWSGVAASADGTTLVAAASVLRPFAEGAVLSGDGLIYRSTNSGASWYATGAPSDNWKAIASSSDGTRLVAAVDTSVSTGGGLIYVSTNSGLTWIQTLTGNGFSSVASSADGTRLVAADPCSVGLGGGIIWCTGWPRPNLYVSTNSGASFTVTSAPGAWWGCVASSADGMTLAAACSWAPTNPAGVYLSHDGGENWALTTLGPGPLTAVASSADGQRLVAANQNGQLATLPYVGPWTVADAPAVAWTAIASSQDVRSLVATGGNQVYISTDSGQTWSPTSAPTNVWQSVASSADAARLVAAASADGGDGFIYTSTNSGVTWSQTGAPSLSWVSVACSTNAATVAAVPEYGVIFVSPNSGTSFFTNGPMNGWSAVASSASGIRLVAASTHEVFYGQTDRGGVLGDGVIYVSTNSGVTWAPSGAPTNSWSAVASSADGTKLAAVAATGPLGEGFWEGTMFNLGDFLGDGMIYTSRDSGATWNLTTAPAEGWTSVACSADGGQLAATAANGAVFVSSDSGASWAVSDTPGWSCSSVQISADGSNIVAISTLGSGSIVMLHRPVSPSGPPPPLLSIGLSGANPGLSWVVPSTSFVLQQSSDLSSPNWVDITNQPTFNLTNLRNEMTLPGPPGHAFYRLKQPQ